MDVLLESAVPTHCDTSTPPPSQLAQGSPAASESTPLSDYVAEISQTSVSCCCSGVSSTDNPPYRHLGSASSVLELRQRLESKLNLPTPALRIEMVAQAEREGATEHGCPAAKWILRRLNDQEKILVLVRERQGHVCPSAVIVVALVSWEGVPKVLADQALEYLAAELPRRGFPSERRCASNESRTCACQGFDEATCGSSYSFGCSWSMFHNACKFARTREHARKFRLRTQDAEAQLAGSLNSLADVAGQVLEALAPDAFLSQVRDSELAADCRLGREAPLSRRPFSGVTACLDFCAHPHKDTFALDGGCNVVVTLTRQGAADEQLHVFPGYAPALTDEFGSAPGQQARLASGEIETLTVFQNVTRLRGVPLTPCTTRKKVKKAAQQQAQHQVQKQNLQQKQQEANHSVKSHQQGSRATVKEEHSPASIDSGFESIKSNRSPDKDEQQQHLSPPVAQAPPMGVLPPIASWFRKAANQWSPHQQLHQQRQEQQQMPLSSIAATGCYPDPRIQQHIGGQPLPLQPPSSLPPQQHQPNNAARRPDLRLQFYPQQGAGATQGEFAQPQQPLQSPQHQYPPQHHYLPSGPRPPGMPYQSHQQQPQHPGVYPRYPPEQPGAAYPGSYTPSQWRPHQQVGNGQYYSGPQQQQQQQQHQRMPLQYRPPPYPQSYPNQQQPPYHHRPSHYELDYPYQQQYYPQQQLHYPQYYPYPQQQHQMHHQQQQQQQQIQTPQQQKKSHTAGNQAQTETKAMTSAVGSKAPLVPSKPTAAPKRQASSSAESSKAAVATIDREFVSDNADLFKDNRSGGLAIALPHGSVLIEAAKYDSHATTALRKPDRNQATAISLVYFQHKSLCYAHHGYAEYAEKMRLLKLRRDEAKAEANPQANAEENV